MLACVTALPLSTPARRRLIAASRRAGNMQTLDVWSDDIYADSRLCDNVQHAAYARQLADFWLTRIYFTLNK